VLVEGLYLLLNTPPWNQLSDLYDERWFLNVPVDNAMYAILSILLLDESAGARRAEDKIAVLKERGLQTILFFFFLFQLL
jgi:hypothetical protein